MSSFFWVNYEPATCHGCHQPTRGGWCPDCDPEQDTEDV